MTSHSNAPILANAIRGALVAKWPALASFPAQSFVDTIQEVVGRFAFDGVDKGDNTIPPSLELVTAYFKGLGSKTDPEEFILFYQQKNWMVSRSQRMKDWRSAAQRWHRNKWGVPKSMGGDGGRKAFFA
jgi:hypothetical protein